MLKENQTGKILETSCKDYREVAAEGFRPALADRSDPALLKTFI